jgi:hypothetical protein
MLTDAPWDTSISTSVECPRCRLIVSIDRVNGGEWIADDGRHVVADAPTTKEVTATGNVITVCHDPVVIRCNVI